MAAAPVCLWPLEGLPEVTARDDLAGMLASAAAGCEAGGLQNGDVVVVTSKVVSKAEGRVIPAASVRPSRLARRLARATGKSPEELQVVLDASSGILGILPLRLALDVLGAAPFRGQPDQVRQALERERSLLVTRMSGGGLATDAGVDCSNVPEGFCLLPQEPDASARRLRGRLHELTGAQVAVIVADTEFRPFRQGTTDIALGVAGMAPIRSQFGAPDRLGRPKVGGMDAVADLLAGAAALLMGQTTEGVPAVLVRGVAYPPDETATAACLTMPLRWLKLGALYLVWSRLRLAVARWFGL